MKVEESAIGYWLLGQQPAPSRVKQSCAALHHMHVETVIAWESDRNRLIQSDARDDRHFPVPCSSPPIARWPHKVPHSLHTGSPVYTTTMINNFAALEAGSWTVYWTVIKHIKMIAAKHYPNGPGNNDPASPCPSTVV